MKLDAFLKEHDLKIKVGGTEKEPIYTLVRVSDEKQISPPHSMRDFIIHWMKKNTNEIYFKLYNEEN